MVIRGGFGSWSGGCGVLRLGLWRQKGRHPTFGRTVLRRAVAVDFGFGGCWYSDRQLVTGTGGAFDYWWRGHRGAREFEIASLLPSVQFLLLIGVFVS